MKRDDRVAASLPEHLRGLYKQAQDMKLTADFMERWAVGEISLQKPYEEVREYLSQGLLGMIAIRWADPTLRMVLWAILEEAEKRGDVPPGIGAAALSTIPLLPEDAAGWNDYHILRCFLLGFPADSVKYLSDRYTQADGSESQQKTIKWALTLLCRDWPQFAFHFSAVTAPEGAKLSLQ